MYDIVCTIVYESELIDMCEIKLKFIFDLKETLINIFERHRHICVFYEKI